MGWLVTYAQPPSGSFTMGSPKKGENGAREDEPGRFDDEGPQHAVTFKRPFAVGKFEVTVDQFAAFTKETGYDAGSECFSYETGKWEKPSGRSWRNPGYKQDDSHPAACLNWNDAKAYVAWLAKKIGKALRRVLVRHFGGPPLRHPRRVHLGLPRQHRRLSTCPNAFYALNLDLFTS